jgi:hypothetical protein
VSDVLKGHLDAIAATVSLLGAQVGAARHAMGLTVPSATVSLPPRCTPVDKTRCALREGDWVSRSSFANPRLQRCNGCGYEGTADG